MATPVFRALRAAHPSAEIVLEGRPALQELLAGLASFDRFLPDPGGGALAALARGRRLKRQDFDWAVLLPDSQRAALGPWLARVPRRVGYARDALRRALLTEALPAPRRAGRRLPVPMTERYLRITRHLGCSDRGDGLELAVSPGAAERCAARLRQLGVDPDAPRLLVTPGASFGASKLWPPEHFAAACDGIAERLGLLPVLSPGPGEEEIARRIVAAASRRIVALLDPTPGLAELKALVAGSSLLLTNDTGPRHVAVALGCPAIVVMGPTDPRHTAQHLQRQRVLREDVECSPCQRKRCPIDHRCMTRLAPGRAVHAAEDLLA
jgi:heptosyltransferase-2